TGVRRRPGAFRALGAADGRTARRVAALLRHVGTVEEGGAAALSLPRRGIAARDGGLPARRWAQLLRGRPLRRGVRGGRGCADGTSGAARCAPRALGAGSRGPRRGGLDPGGG